VIILIRAQHGVSPSFGKPRLIPARSLRRLEFSWHAPERSSISGPAPPIAA
jgi:hypothetical protein